MKYILFHTQNIHTWARPGHILFYRYQARPVVLAGTRFRYNRPFTPQPGSTYSTPGFNHFTQIQILFSHTDIGKCQSRQIISSQTRFTLPTENLISLSFIIVAHNRHNMLVPFNSREWFRVEKPVHFPICVVLKSNENKFAFNYRRSRCNSMWGFKHVLYIFIHVVMHFLWAIFVNIQLHAETDLAKSYAQIRILWNRSTADALAP